MIDLYAMSSPNVAKVLLMLEETGLDYRAQWVDVIGAAQHAADFRAINPNGKVPAITDTDGPDGTPITVWESGAILVYLAEKTGRFLPSGSADRYAVLQWLMFQMGGIGPMFGNSVHFTAAVKDDSYGRRRFQTEMHRLLDVLDARLAQSPYLAGGDYSIADMAVYPWLFTAHKFFKEAMIRPAVERWRADIAHRPATQRMEVKLKELWAQDEGARQGATKPMWDRYLGRVEKA